MEKIVFITERVDTGGIQRVVSVITNEIRCKYEIKIYSNQNYPIRYEYQCDVVMHNGNSKVKKKINKGIRKLLINGLNYETNPELLNYRDYKDALSFIEEQKPSYVVLLAEWSLIAKKIKELNPNIKIISWLHQSFDTYKTIDFKAHYKYFMDNLNYSDKVIVLTDYDKTKYEKYLSNVEVIANPVTLKRKSKEVATYSDESRKIRCVSRLAMEQKGLDFLIEVAAILPSNYQIELAGTGSKKEIKKIQELILVKNLSHKIKLVGQLNDTELENFYLNGNIFLMTSRWEGFVLTIIEAMNYGLPIIAYENTGTRAITLEGKCGRLIELGDIQGMKDGIISILENKDIFENLQKKSLQRAEELSLPLIGKQWKKLIEEIG